MGYANIQLHEQTIKIQTVPGSGLIKVLLPGTQYSFYNPATGMFSTSRPEEGFEPLLGATQLQELKQKLNTFDEHRRAEIARFNRFTSGA